MRAKKPATVDPSGLRRILLRLPNWLGDVCFAAPAAALLADAAPRADFVAACRRNFAPLAARLPRVKSVVVVDESKGLRGTLRSARELKKCRCDAAVVFPRSLRAAMPVSLARIPVRVGFASDARSLFLTHPVRGWKPLRLAHRIDYFGALLSPFGLAAPTAPWAFSPPREALSWADAWLKEDPRRRKGKPLVAMEPGGAYGVAKRWPEERYAALAGRLVREGTADVVLVGTADMAPLHDRIAAAAKAPILRAAGKTDLLQLSGLLLRSSLLVTNDTGPMHLAAAMGVPIVALFGSTDPHVCGPRGTGSATVVYEKVPCSPCYLKECPVEGHPCLDQFDVERVHALVRSHLR